MLISSVIVSSDNLNSDHEAKNAQNENHQNTDILTKSDNNYDKKNNNNQPINDLPIESIVIDANTENVIDNDVKNIQDDLTIQQNDDPKADAQINEPSEQNVFETQVEKSVLIKVLSSSGDSITSDDK